MALTLQRSWAEDKCAHEQSGVLSACLHRHSASSSTATQREVVNISRRSESITTRGSSGSPERTHSYGEAQRCYCKNLLPIPPSPSCRRDHVPWAQHHLHMSGFRQRVEKSNVKKLWISRCSSIKSYRCEILWGNKREHCVTFTPPWHRESRRDGGRIITLEWRRRSGRRECCKAQWWCYYKQRAFNQGYVLKLVAERV